MKKIVAKKPKRAYSLGEEIFSAVTHGVGALLSIIALVLMLMRATQSEKPNAIFASAMFGGTLIILYTMSTLYHSLAAKGAKKVFRIFDHDTIFLLIAGTYTPYLLVAMNNRAAWCIFFVLWALAAVGIVFDSIMLDKFRKIEMVLYVCMGWCILLALGSLLENLAPMGFALLLAGGIFYTVGIVFYAMKKVKYMHSIWHLFVLCGSALQFFSVYLYVL